MQRKIHPKLNTIKIELLNGQSFETKSTYGKEGGTLKLDVDPTVHAAWTGQGNLVDNKATEVQNFKSKFDQFSLFDD